VLECSSNTVRYGGDGHPSGSPVGGTIGCYYYGQGRLFCLFNYSGRATVGRESTHCPWNPGIKDLFRWRRVRLSNWQDRASLSIRTVNWTGAGDSWRPTWRRSSIRWAAVGYVEGGRPHRPVFKSTRLIHFGNRLLMGHYPTGNLYEYDGQQIRLLPDRPPAMPGVSKRARRGPRLCRYIAASFTRGSGRGERMWRYDRGRDRWKFIRRMLHNRRSPTP